jgi:predicted Zn-dependent protease
MRIRRTVAAALAAAFLAGTMGSSVGAEMPPLTPGYRPALDTAEGGLWQVMDKVEADIKVSPALVKDPALNAYVSKLVCDLAGPQCSSLRVYIVDDPSSNAFTAPNGMVVVWTGLLVRVQNEAELAFVLGHEITHYLKRHSVRNFEKFTNTAGTIAVLSAATAGLAALPALFVGLGAIASYSRDQEREADAGGFDLIVAKGYDPRQGALFMTNTSAEEDANPDRDKPMAYLASHPTTKERQQNLTKRAAELEAKSHADVVGTEPYRVAIAPFRGAWLEEEFVRGDYKQSVVMVQQLVKADPDAAELQFYLGEAYRRRNTKGDAQTAIAAYRSALAKESPPAAAYRGLGLVSLKTGEKNAAREAFLKYLELAPDAQDRTIVEYYLSSIGGPK